MYLARRSQRDSPFEVEVEEEEEEEEEDEVEEVKEVEEEEQSVCHTVPGQASAADFQNPSSAAQDSSQLGGSYLGEREEKEGREKGREREREGKKERRRAKGMRRGKK